jgi:parallel beta-helix repeat protein
VYAALPTRVTGKYESKDTLLTQVAPKQWLLRRSLQVEEGATLIIRGGAAGDVVWLKLRSVDTAPTAEEPFGGVFLRAKNSTLRIEGTKVTSWDDVNQVVDSTYSVDDPTTPAYEGNGRSYISARSLIEGDTAGNIRPLAPPTACGVNGGTREPYEGRMDVVNSEVAYLGYKFSESWGLSWKVDYKGPANPTYDLPSRQLFAEVDIFGSITGTTIHDNYFGAYTFGGYCMDFKDSVYEDNIKYGLDPHDDSDYLVITGNTFRRNGSHGLICSRYCNNLLIADNTSYRNIGVANEDEIKEPYAHGIMIHRSVTDSIVERNTSYENNGGGIAVFESYNNIIRNNTVRNNGQAALRLSVGSHNNLFESNILEGLNSTEQTLTRPGYIIYTYKGSDLPEPGASDGFVRNNVFRNNQMTGYKSPLIRLQEGIGNIFEGNTITGPGITFDMERGSTDNVVRMTGAELGQWVFSIDNTSSVTGEVSGFQAYRCYQVSGNGTPFARRLATGIGAVPFLYQGQGAAATTFSVVPGTGCQSPIYMPLVRR